MNADAAWNRALLLAQQGRGELAIPELRRLLGLDPEHVYGHALLAQLLAERRELAEALQLAQRAVGLAPDLSLPHHALAVVHREARRLDQAAASASDAIELDAEDVDHYALLAQIRLDQKRWQEGLALADHGLTLDPEHVTCLNLRSLALLRLGRKQEATDSLDASLSHDPDNPYTHQARGFALLNRGDAKGALEHFREALRRDPTLDGARAGLVEAIKARNPIYRVVLSLMLWLDRFTTGRQQQILVGAWLLMLVGRRVLAGTGNENAAMVLGLAWFGVVMLLACTGPVFNLLLLLHPLGRHALDPRPKHDAMLFGGAILLLVGVGLHAWFGEASWSKIGWVWFVVFLMPVAGLGNFEAGWARRTLQGFCVGALAFAGWWMFRLEALATTLLVDDPGSNPPAMSADARAQLDAHLSLLGTLVLITALSTWFVLLAPKGHGRR